MTDSDFKCCRSAWWPLLGAATLFGVLALIPTGCDRTPEEPSGSGLAGIAIEGSSSSDGSADARPAPRTSFSADVSQLDPELLRFVIDAADTLLNNDYSQYRSMVSRRQRPEPRERFDAISRALRSIEVTAVEPLELPQLGPEVYRVLAAFEVDSESIVAGRIADRSIAMLVFREKGDWRLTLAPGFLQPEEAEASDAAASRDTAESEPAQPEVEYPWDVGVDD